MISVGSSPETRANGKYYAEGGKTNSKHAELFLTFVYDQTFISFLFFCKFCYLTDITHVMCVRKIYNFSLSVVNIV